jgi:uncharacterized membrane protein
VVVAAAGWRIMSLRVRRAEARIGELELEVARLKDGAAAPGPEPMPAAGAADDLQPPAPALGRGPEAAAAGTEPAPPPTDAGVVEAPRPPLPTLATPPLPVPEEPEGARTPAIEIDWERWVGVRGAAVAGGVVLALAALLFFKYSVEHGLIPPIVRVVLGVAAGVAAIWASEMLRKRGYEPAANALAGAGVVVLYGALWAANRLYDLLPTAAAYASMVVVTLACGVLAWRHRSLVIAILGLAGGFATPLLLATGADHPIGLFGYILLLDAGLLVLAQRRRWPVLGVLGLAATVLYEAGWILDRMDAEQKILGLVIVAVFAVLFALGASRGRRGAEPHEELGWRISGVAGVLVPFALSLYFAGRSDLGAHLWGIAALLLLLSLAAAWTARELDRPGVAVAAAAADVAVVLVWCGRTRFSDALAWEAVAIAGALTLAFLLMLEYERRRPGPVAGEGLERPAVVAAIGFLVLLVGVPLGAVESFWPWFAGWAVLAAVLVRLAGVAAFAWLTAVSGGLAGLGFALFFAVHGRTPVLPAPPLFFGLVLAAAAVFQLLAVTRPGGPDTRWREAAAAVLPLTVLLALVVESGEPSLAPGLYHLVSILLALLVVLASTRLEEGRLVLAVMAVLALQHLQWVTSFPGLADAPGTALAAMAFQLAAVGLFVAWPFLAAGRLVGNRWAWYAAALAPVVWFPSLKRLYEIRFGDASIGLLPLLLAGVALAAAYRSRGLWAAGDPNLRRNLAWFAAVALAFTSVAIPLQLDKQWVTIGWALEGAAVMVLWRQLDHPGLKYFGLLLLAAVTVRLVANPAVLGYSAHSGWPVLNWLAYTYLVPAACLVGAALVLRPLEVARALEAERPLYARRWAVGSAGCGLAAVAVVFVWINLTVFDAFSRGAPLSVSFERMPARDLTLSLAWAVYALLLLAIGMARRSQGLRWISLAFLVLTIGKVFLYDLGELRDLYRVASLLGLAASLILVSLAYQRFVFGRAPEPGV